MGALPRVSRPHEAPTTCYLIVLYEYLQMQTVWLEFEGLFLTAWRTAKHFMIRLESQIDDGMSPLPSGVKTVRLEFDVLLCQVPPLST